MTRNGTGHDRYPEHEKLKALDGLKEAVQGFLDWLLDEAGIELSRRRDVCSGCSRDEDDCTCRRFEAQSVLGPWIESRESLMARHFGIDLQRLSAEKDAMYESMLSRQRERWPEVRLPTSSVERGR